MTWQKETIYLPRYEFVSCNQHGERFKCAAPEQVSVARISCERNDAAGMLQLILLSDTLDVPVRYDFTTGDQEAYIEVVSNETLRGLR